MLQEKQEIQWSCSFIRSVYLFLDPSNAGGDSMYAMMKSVPGGNMSAVSSLILKLNSHAQHVKFTFYIINVCSFSTWEVAQTPHYP